MICDFSQAKRTQNLLEEEIQVLKQEYLKQEMKPEEVRVLLNKVDTAKRRNKALKYKRTAIRITATCAALVTVLMILPNTSPRIAHAMGRLPVVGSLIQVMTFRHYQFESDRNKADIEIPEVVQINPGENMTVQENLEQSVNTINADIQRITDDIITQFETYLSDEQGYQDYIVKSEILTTTESFFTVKLMCYQGAGSGYQWNYYYTVDLGSGELLQLKDLFLEGADYITPISESIRQQMQEQMDADEMVYYWLHDEIEALNFKSIAEDTSFYVNERNNIVIGFDEGDVAPMYMGALEFEIPSEVLASIRK